MYCSWQITKGKQGHFSLDAQIPSSPKECLPKGGNVNNYLNKKTGGIELLLVDFLTDLLRLNRMPMK
jgi:hypothetical protein